MTALERLLAEGIPDGTFGGPRPTRAPPTAQSKRPDPDPDAARHVAELLEALDQHDDDARRRHLRAIPTAA